jgi:predicted transcriptional regulator with HTH domain
MDRGASAPLAIGAVTPSIKRTRKSAVRCRVLWLNRFDGYPEATYTQSMTLPHDPSELKYKLQGLSERVEVLRGFL